MASDKDLNKKACSIDIDKSDIENQEFKNINFN